jgi:hypothetical protein
MGLERSKTAIGAGPNQNMNDINNKNADRKKVYLAGVELARPRMPEALYFSRGDGSFITGK